MDEDIPTATIDIERPPSPRLKRGVQFSHPRRSEGIIKNIIEDTHTTAINIERSPSPSIEEFEDGNLEPPKLVKHFEPDHAQENGNIMETSPSHSLKRGIGEVETFIPCDGNPSPPESVKRSKIEHARENGDIADDKAMAVKPRGVLRPRNLNGVASESPPTLLDNLNIQEISGETQITERKSVRWDPDGDNDQTLWIEEKKKKEQQARAKELTEPCFSVDFFSDKEEWRDFVDNSPLAKALKSAPEEMINEIANQLVIEQSSTLRVITKRVQDESEDEVIIFTDSAALLRFRKELLLALEPYFGMQYILCGSCETLHRHCHCCSKIDYFPEPYPAKPCATRVSLVCKSEKWNHLSLKSIDFAHIQKGMKYESHNQNHRLFKQFKLLQTTQYRDADKTYRIMQLNEIFVAEERGLRLLHRKQDWFFGTGKDMKKLKTAVRDAIWLQGEGPYPGVCRHFERKDLQLRLLYFVASIPGPSTLYSCDECALEWQIDVVDIKTENSSGQAFVFTIWRDLGRCLSPFDPRWTAHFEEYDGDEYKNNFYHLHDEKGPIKGWREDEEPVNDWALGGVRKAFERDEDWELDVEVCLTKKHLKLLTDVSNPEDS
jgi:hypothetical protein